MDNNLLESSFGIYWGHRSQAEIVDVVVRKTGKTLEGIKQEKGPLRQNIMDLPHRQGLTNPEIGLLFGLDYSSVSQERKRLRQCLEKDKKVFALHRDIE